MLAAHTLPGDGNAFYDGRSAILFATLAGVSLGLMTGGEHPVDRAAIGAASRARARLSIAIRALLLIALGLGLWQLHTTIAIILDRYGFLFLVCLPLLFVNRWVMGALAAIFALIGHGVVDALIAATSPGGVLPIADDNPLAVPLSWLDSYYPAPVWIAYVLAGLTLARFGVTRPRVQVVMIVGGATVAALGYGLSSAFGDPVMAHTDTPMEAISSGSFAIAVIGLLVAAVARIRRNSVRNLIRPLIDAGAMPLSIYTAQVLVIALVGVVHPKLLDDATSWTLFVCLTLGSLIFAVLWRLRFTQGPLEWVFARLSLRREWRTPRSAAGPDHKQRGATPTR